jgi:hypothetical protein
MSDGSTLPWPLLHIVDEDKADTGFAILRSALGRGQKAAFTKMSADHKMIGFTQLGPYPLYHEGYQPQSRRKDPTAGWQRSEIAACIAWCHCFRDPDAYLPPGLPRLLLSSGSDFTDVERVTRLGGWEDAPVKRWDLIYSCLPNWFNDLQKNWNLGRACVERLAEELNLRILLVGRHEAADVPRHPNIEVRPQLGWTELLACTARSRMAFLPNELDASPRVLTEALVLDVPVLVNTNILGGWKYVNEDTGRFFTDEYDVVAAAEQVLAMPVRPRDWYLEHSGPENSAPRLAEYLRRLGAPESLAYARPASTVDA